MALPSKRQIAQALLVLYEEAGRRTSDWFNDPTVKNIDALGDEFLGCGGDHVTLEQIAGWNCVPRDVEVDS